MKALSLTQPWASLVAFGAKSIETRSWGTSYRGPIAIAASKVFPGWAHDECDEEPFEGALLKELGERPNPVGCTNGISSVLPRGAIVAVADLVHCGRITEGPRGEFWAEIDGHPERVTGDELAFGNYESPDNTGRYRYGWIFTNVRRLPEPIPCRGALGLWPVPAEIEARIAAAVRS